jgi:hypothetical protein
MLASGELCVTLFANGYALVTSPNGSYRVNGECPCAARTSHCYHRAAKRLVEMIEETAPAVVSHDTRTCEHLNCDECDRIIGDQVERDIAAYDARAALIADIKARWPHHEYNLADELMARFKRNQLEMLSIDFLQAIQAVI